MNIHDRVADLWSEGYSDDEIIDILLDEDYDFYAILDALGCE